MIIAGADRMEQEVGSKYALVILAAKRARHLKEGATPLVRSVSANPLTVALEEIGAGKVRSVGPEQETPRLDLEPPLEIPAEPPSLEETE